MEQSKEIQYNWTGLENFGVCFWVSGHHLLFFSAFSFRKGEWAVVTNPPKFSDFSEIFYFHKTFLQLVLQFLYLVCYTRSIFILLVANEGCNNHCTDPKYYDQGRYFSLTKIFFCSLHFAQWFKKVGSCINLTYKIFLDKRIKFWFLAQLVLRFY